jgi:cytochrome c peroxidase
MRHSPSRMFRASILLLPALLLAGCQRARPYDPRPAGKSSATAGRGADEPAGNAEKPIPQDYAWMDDTGRLPDTRAIRIEFVHEATQPEEWKKLKTFWNDPGLAGTAALGLTGLPGMAALAAGQARATVRIKVPLGLDDPLAYIPAANPPTRGKWELGRRLFFDPGWLTAKGDRSCASCHVPSQGFTDGRPRFDDSYNVPTLINCVYSSHQFWDGRATYLEEVVQRTFQDEREPKDPGGTFRHAWPGVIGRLRKDERYIGQFNAVFSVPPTQDAVGKALATYMRTLLAGDSLHDRAVRVQQEKGARALAGVHYEAVLDEPAMKALGRSSAVKAVLANDLLRGYTLFHGRAGCVSCHPSSNGYYSDSRFYNIGVGTDGLDRPGGQLGRFAWAPAGERNRYLRGAFKSPTLRSLLRTAPYFHNGQAADLESAVRFHVESARLDAPLNLYLDPKLADRDGSRRNFGLGNDDIDALVLFLKALNGEEVDRFVATNPN